MQASTSLERGPLARFLGSWKGEVSVEAGGGPPKHHAQHHTFAWALGGCFLEERGEGGDGSAFLGMWSFVPGTGLYQAHYFLAPAGTAVVIVHAWDEASLTLTGSAELGGGATMRARDHFLDHDRYEWSIEVEDGQGRLLSRMHAHERRIGDAPRPAPRP